MGMFASFKSGVKADSLELIVSELRSELVLQRHARERTVAGHKGVDHSADPVSSVKSFPTSRVAISATIPVERT
jgi:hypothetical protein